ncbi:MAG: hypothetical protein AAB968_03845 [Patescibacteria group bacterium]
MSEKSVEWSMLTHDDIKAVPYVQEETAVIGDVDEFIKYVESGQALKEWNEKILALNKDFDEYVKQHAQVWNHIVIFYCLASE